ncbi:hypothetical protein DFJ63DRAFT_322236 [Scheffersomyces coipomensis]|uniref:uncharacterized protein n=1 Tax=Scheffersomyces coipomensis TaxID=1788519 RepID=UPI00315D8F69
MSDLLVDLFPTDVSKIYIFTSISVVCGIIFVSAKLNQTIHSLLVFAWACFIQPLIQKKSSGFVKSKNQQQNLEQFYKNQAHIYDSTREFLLKGRKECLRLAYSHLSKKKDLVWIDVGGGTGSNIEYMNEIASISKNFKAVYLVDLSPSLCEVAQKRVEAHEWDNVHVLVADACDFEIDYKFADLITFSYSLSMIPTFNAAIDNAVSKLDKQGIVAAVDFGIQSVDTSIGRINTLGGLIDRNIPWVLRNFWRIWFEADKVYLDSSRRNYLEYKFGTVKSLNTYNKRLGRIPYYIWIGCDKSKSSTILHRLNCLATESPYLAPSSTPISNSKKIAISKGHEAALSNLQKNLPFPSIYYQKEIWRVYYDDLNHQFEQFKNQYIYAFTWEDPREDNNILKFSPNDTVLAITSAGDNILSYATLPDPPKRIHAVDLNPCQNHLLELKLASFRCLSHEQIWKMFGEGKIDNFKDLLIDKLSPHMSSNAFQYWMQRGEKTFKLDGKGLYDTGSTRWALRLAKYVFKISGVTKYVKDLCHAPNMDQQLKIWNDSIKPAIFNPIVATLLVGNPLFLWKALGVPANQAAMMGNSVIKYVIDTLDPLLKRSLISKDNYFYYLCLMGYYAYDNCPDYLTVKGYKRLTTQTTTLNNESPIDNIRLHTDTLNDVFARLSKKSITIAIIMDHMDWFDPHGTDEINEITALKKCLVNGGRVMLRSASTNPWYIKSFEKLGFKCEAAAVRVSGESIDRINMYASTWVCTKVDTITEEDEDDEEEETVDAKALPMRRRMSSLHI